MHKSITQDLRVLTAPRGELLAKATFAAASFSSQAVAQGTLQGFSQRF